MTNSPKIQDPRNEIELAEGEEIVDIAQFDHHAIIRYHYLGLIPVAMFIVTIPIVLLVGLGYRIFLTRIVASWSTVLTNRNLHVRKGIFNKTEKTIPLEKITDLSSVEGLLMRFAGIKRLGIETAGQSGPGSLVSLLGVVGSDAFRGRVLAQRDHTTKVSGAPQKPVAATEAAEPAETTLIEIRDTLAKMAADLRQVTEQLDRTD